MGRSKLLRVGRRVGHRPHYSKPLAVSVADGVSLCVRFKNFCLEQSKGFVVALAIVGRLVAQASSWAPIRRKTVGRAKAHQAALQARLELTPMAPAAGVLAQAVAADARVPLRLRVAVAVRVAIAG